MSRRFSRFSVLALTLFIPSIILASPSSEIRIGYVKAPFNLQNIVMKEKGLLEKAFEKDGVKISWIPISTGSKQAQSLGSGAIDISAVMNTSSLQIQNSVGNELRIASGVARPAETFAIMDKPGSNLGVKDLKDKKIAGMRGTVLHQLLLRALEMNGLSENDVKLVSMPQPAALAAMHSGAVDAALLAGNQMIRAEKSGCLPVITAKDLVPVNLVTAVRKEFADKHPKEVQKFAEVQKDALNWIRSHKKEAFALASKELGLSEAECEKLFERYDFYSELDGKDIENLKEDQEFLIKQGIIRRPFDVESLILPSAMKKEP